MAMADLTHVFMVESSWVAAVECIVWLKLVEMLPWEILEEKETPKKKKKKAILALNWILRQNSCLSYKKKKRFHTSKLYLVVFSSFFLYF